MSQSSPPTGVKCPCGEYWGSSAGGSFAVVSQHDQESLIAGRSDVATCGAQFDHILSTGSGPASSLDWVYDRIKNVPCTSCSNWKRVLEPVAHEPQKYVSTSCCWFDDRVTVIYDGFPKARFHLLIVARDMSVTHLPRAAAALLLHMQRVALALVHRMQQSSGHQAVAFQAGFHSVPSLVPLHMHIISRDFDSPSLKKKLHFNSFQEPFFISASSAAAGAGADIDHVAMERSLKVPMSCHGCGLLIGDALAALKTHIRICSAIQAIPNFV